jgi:glycosyltransferase involved in cell wall biosynthesis
MQGKGSFEKLNQVVGKYYQDHHLVFTHSPSAIERMVANSIGKKHDVWWLGIRGEDFGEPRVAPIARDKPLLISVGRVTKQKNLEVFCQLDHNKYNLVVVGAGTDLDELKGKYPHVDFVGWR